MKFERSRLGTLGRAAILTALIAFSATLFAPVAQALDPDSYHFGILPQVEKPNRSWPWGITDAAENTQVLSASVDPPGPSLHDVLLLGLRLWLTGWVNDLGWGNGTANDTVEIPHDDRYAR